MLKHKDETKKKKSTEPHLEKTGSIWKDAQKMIQAMEAGVETPSSHGEEHESSHGLIGHVAHGLGMISKGAHVIQKHLPHSLHKIEEVAEVVAEVFQDDTSGNIIEDTVCGALSGVAKVGAATAGMLVLPEIEIPIMMETALGSLALEVGAGLSAGALVQHAFDAVTKPVGDAVKDVCHGSFDLVKDILAGALEESKPNLELKPQESKISNFSSKAQAIFSRTNAPASLRPINSKPSYLGPNKSMYSPVKPKASPKATYRGDDFTAAFNKERGPWISPDYRREIQGALREYFGQHQSQADRLLHRFIPAFGFKNSAEKEAIFRYFEQDAADAFMKLYPESDLKGIDRQAFVKHYFSSLLQPEQANLPQGDFEKELNQRLASDPKYSEVRAELHRALPVNEPVYDPAAPLKDCASYANKSAEYAQAVSLLSMAGMVDKKTGDAANKIMLGASAIGIGTTALASSGFALGPAGLVAAGGLLCMSVVADALRGGDDEPGPNPIMVALEAQAKQLSELLRLCSAMYKDVMEQFKLLNEKLDSYHLDHVKRFLELWLASEYNHANVLDYLRRYHTVLSEQLQEVQRILPDIKDACHQLRLQSVSQHLEIMANFRILHLEVDRRLVTEVRNRMDEHARLEDKISEEELDQSTLRLQCSATREAKEAHLTQARLSISFLERDNMAAWIRDIDVIERNLVLPIAAATTVEEAEVVAAHAIGFLQQAGATCINLRCKDKVLAQPLLLLDRGLAFIELLQAYKKQKHRDFFPETVRVRLEAIITELKTLQIFYNFDLGTQLKDILQPYIEEDLDSFVKAAIAIQKEFYKEKFQAARREQAAVLRQDIILSRSNELREMSFKIPVEWERFYYRFGYERYRCHTDYPGTDAARYVGREYIYEDWDLYGWDAYHKKVESLQPSFPLSFPFHSSFQTVLQSFPYGHREPSADMNVCIRDDQADASYSDPWNSLHSPFFSFDEFSAALVEGTSSGLSPDVLKAFLKELHDFNKASHQATDKGAYLVTHSGNTSQLTRAETLCTQELVIPDSLIINDHLTKPLPLRLAKPKERIRGLISQGLAIDLEKLSLHPSLRQLENRGVYYISVEYDIHVLDNGHPHVHQIAFTFDVMLRPLNPAIAPVTIYSKTLSPLRYSSVYSLDEAIYKMWYEGSYISGEVHDLSCKMISNTYPVPAFEKKHPLLLQQLDIQLNQDYNHLVRQEEAEWQRVLRGRLLDSLGRSTEPMRHYFKRLEANVACLKTFAALLHHNDPSIAAFVVQPKLNLFTEAGLRDYISSTAKLEIKGHYNGYYLEAIDGPLTRMTIPEIMKHPKIEELLYEARYFHGVVASDQFMRNIAEARKTGRLVMETLVSSIETKQVLADEGLVQVQARQAEDYKTLQMVLYGSSLLVSTGIFPLEGLAHLEASFEELGGELLEESVLDDAHEDDASIEILQRKTTVLFDEWGVVVVEDLDSDESDAEEESDYWELIRPRCLKLSEVVRLTAAQQASLIDALAEEGFIVSTTAEGRLQVLVSKTAYAVRKITSYNSEGLFPILLKYWTENWDEEDVYVAVERLLKSKSKAVVKTLVNEVEPTLGKTPLHLACEQGAVDLVKFFLSEEANITLKDKENHLAWENAPVIVKESLRALIETRGAWQAKAKDLGFSFNRALWLIEQAMEYFLKIGAIKVPGILFMGPTRAGKSTLMNACLGTRYQRIPGKRHVEPVPGDKEFAGVGHRTTSETMYPNIHVAPDYAIIDCPGFDENRGLAEIICHGVSFYALEEQLETIKGMVLVCDQHEIKHPFVTLRRSLEQIGMMTMKISADELAKNLCLIVTKPSGAETLVDELREWLEEDFADITAESDEKSWAVKRVLVALTSSKDGVMLADVTSHDSMEKVRAKISSLNAQAKKSYDFTRPQHELQVFRQFLGQMLEAHQRLEQEERSLQYGLARMYFDALSKDGRSFPPVLQILKEELLQLYAAPEIEKKIEAVEATLHALIIAERYSENLDALRQDLLYAFSCLLECAENLSAGSEKELQQALKARHAELEVNRVFFEQTERIAAMLGGVPMKASMLSSPLFFRPAMSAAEQSVCLPDGNCAYNSFALFLRDIFLNLDETHPVLLQAVEVIQTLEGLEDLNTVAAVKAYFATLTPNEMQRLLATKLRQNIVQYMQVPEHHYQAIFLERLQVMLQFRREDPMNFDIPDADTFLVHPFIREKFMQILREYSEDAGQQQAALSTWWNDEGFAHYLEEIALSASFAFDRARWGGAPELDCLGKLFNVDVCISKNNRGFEHLGEREGALLECKLQTNGVHWSYTKQSVIAAPSMRATL